MKSKLNQISFNFTNGIYTGRVNSQNRPHGRGKMKYKDGSVFDGFFCNGFKHGNGILTFPSGNKYCGQFFNDLRKGYGEFYYFESEECYVGYWENNVREGRGEYRFKDGSIFRGIFKKDVKHGVGKKISQSMIYTGHWNNGKKNGVFKFKHIATGKETIIKYVNDKRVQIKNLKSKNTASSQVKISPKKIMESNQKNLNSKVSLTKNSLIQMDPNIQPLSGIFSQNNNRQVNIENHTKDKNNFFEIDSDKHVFNTDPERVKKKIKMGNLYEIKEVPEDKLQNAIEEKKPLFLLSFDKISNTSKKKENNLSAGETNKLNNYQRDVNLLNYKEPAFYDLKKKPKLKFEKFNSLLLGKNNPQSDLAMSATSLHEQSEKSVSIDLNRKKNTNSSFK
jgi:hypothetical protein